MPDTPGPHPVLVVLHERYGLQDHQRDLCVRSAVDGLVAVAPNLFFREPDLEAIARAEARAEVSDEQVSRDIDAALDYLAANVPAADTKRIGQPMPQLKEPNELSVIDQPEG